jgi:hypothetical protein
MNPGSRAPHGAGLGAATVASTDPVLIVDRERENNPSGTLSNPRLTWGDVVISTTPVGRRGLEPLTPSA